MQHPKHLSVHQDGGLVQHLLLGNLGDDLGAPVVPVVVVVEASGGVGVEVLAKPLVFLECNDSHYIKTKRMA